MNERRRKLVPVNSIFLVQQAWAHTGEVTHVRCTNGLPADAVCCGLTYDHMRDVYYFCYQSAEWDEVPDCEMLPIFNPTFVNFYVEPFLDEAERLIRTQYGADANKWIDDYRTFKKMMGYSDGD